MEDKKKKKPTVKITDFSVCSKWQLFLISSTKNEFSQGFQQYDCSDSKGRVNPFFTEIYFHTTTAQLFLGSYRKMIKIPIITFTAGIYRIFSMSRMVVSTSNTLIFTKPTRGNTWFCKLRKLRLRKPKIILLICD